MGAHDFQSPPFRLSFRKREPNAGVWEKWYGRTPSCSRGHGWVRAADAAPPPPHILSRCKCLLINFLFGFPVASYDVAIQMDFAFSFPSALRCVLLNSFAAVLRASNSLPSLVLWLTPLGRTSSTQPRPPTHWPHRVGGLCICCRFRSAGSATECPADTAVAPRICILARVPSPIYCYPLPIYSYPRQYTGQAVCAQRPQYAVLEGPHGSS